MPEIIHHVVTSVDSIYSDRIVWTTACNKYFSDWLKRRTEEVFKKQQNNSLLSFQESFFLPAYHVVLTPSWINIIEQLESNCSECDKYLQLRLLAKVKI